MSTILGISRVISTHLKRILNPLGFEVKATETGVDIYQSKKLVACLAIEYHYPDDSPPDASQRNFRIIKASDGTKFGIWIEDEGDDESGVVGAALADVLR